MDKEFLELGDKVRIKSPYGTKIVTITRVTKTKAVADNIAFKRKISKAYGIERWSRVRFDVCKRELVN